MKTNKATIVFFGTSEFAVPSLKALLDKGYQVAAVVTNPDKPAGRKQVLTPSPVKTFLSKQRTYSAIPVLQPEKLDKSFELQVTNYKPNIFVIASYGKIIPKDILAIPKHGTLNVHPSLLPQYRGPSPIQTAILNGEKKIGVTIMLTDEKVDHGPILAQQELKDTSYKLQAIRYGELHDRLAKLGAELLLTTLPGLLQGKIAPKTQNHTKATYTKIIKKEDGKIDWAHQAKEIERQIRAFEIWPGSWSMARIGEKNLRIKIVKAKIGPPRGLSLETGAIIKKSGGLLVACRNKFLIIEKLQLEGKRIITGHEFLNGYPDTTNILFR